MNMRRVYFRLLLTLILVPLISCSKQKNDAKIVIDAESIRTLADDPEMQLVHVVVNVRGPNMNLINHTWSGRTDDDTIKDPPEFFEISVPSGPDRLIQYLGVYENDEGMMQFYYADQKMAVSPGDVSVELVAIPFGVPTKETTFKGRFLRADGSGPTGKVEWLIAPPGNKPPILIEDKFIYGGWFRFMSFAGAPISYRMKDTGEVLFDQITNGFLTSSKVLKLSFPEFYNGWTGTNGLECYYSDRSHTELYWGYFGPGASSKVIKYDYNSGYGPEFYSNGSGLYSQCVPSALTLRWDDVNPVGGQPVSDCLSETDLCLSGADFSTGFERAYSHGPFKTYRGYNTSDTHYDGVFKITRSIPQQHINAIEWQFLPGVAPTVKDVEVYTRPGTGTSQSGREEGLEELGCSEYLASSGFTKIRTLPGAATIINTNMEQFIGKDFAICPRFTIAGKTVAADVAPRKGGQATPIVSGLPGNVFYGLRYTNQPTATLTVTGVSEFKYLLQVNNSMCPSSDSPDYNVGTPGVPFTVDYSDSEGLISLCMVARNEGGEWSWPQSVADWTFDETAPSTPAYSCVVSGLDYLITLDYLPEYISNLEALIETLEVGFNDAFAQPYTDLLPGLYEAITPYDSRIEIFIPVANVPDLYSFKVKVYQPVDYAGNQGFIDNIENIMCDP